jgi:DNA-binding CsgD family transcriptional regulator
VKMPSAATGVLGFEARTTLESPASSGAMGNARLALEYESADLLQRWAEVEHSAKLIVDRRMFVIWNNAAMDRVFAAQSAIMRVRDQLICPVPDNGARLKLALKATNTGISACHLACASTAQHVLCSCVSIMPVKGEMRFGITIKLSGSKHLSFDLLQQAYELTPAECLLLSRLLRGLTAEESALEGAIAVDTVRTHVRNIYLKLDVTSREAMFHSIIPFIEA